MDWNLDPKVTEDIDDIVVDGENFSDGCGLIGPTFARLLSRKKALRFHGRTYTPCVYQIRYFATKLSRNLSNCVPRHCRYKGYKVGRIYLLSGFH